MKIKNIDHIVIPVSDIDKSLHFYTEVLGMEADTSNQRFAVKFGNQKINLHVGKAQFLPAAKHPAFGSADICLLTEGNIEEIKVEVESKGIEIEVGIVQRRGAQGAIRSIYFRDPDGNLIEVSRDIPKIIKFKATNSLRVSCLFCIFKHSVRQEVV